MDKTVNNQKIDYHVHTEFSPDSKETISNYLTQASKTGVKEIAFTDHIDFYIGDAPKGQYTNEFIKEYATTLDQLKANNTSGVKILKGIEFGQANEDIDRMNYFLEKGNFDFIIGSMHKANELDFKDYIYTEDNLHDHCSLYFEKLYEMVTTTDYDVVGHLDYILRYIWKSGFEFDIMNFKSEINDILKEIIDRGKGIEINNSARHLRPTETFPNKSIIEMYVELGGKIITFGSDAHTAKHLCYGFDETLAVIQKLGIPYFATYSNRKVDNNERNS